jgi:uncharacterized membrane protein (DUF2068 family)
VRRRQLLHRPPGTQRARRFVPRFHWELLVCGFRGHELLGTDARELRAEDALFAIEAAGMRWYRCVRCDSWLPLPQPSEPTHDLPPARAEVDLPLRGKALRDKVVLRLIAIDRALHFVVLALLAGGVLVFASHRRSLRRLFDRVMADYGAAPGTKHHGLVGELERALTLHTGTLRWLAAAAAAYALLEGAEAVGLWFQRRWAEYLTFAATTLLLPVEVWELTKTVSPFKVAAFAVNLAIVVYLLFSKRLFGLRGGAAAERRERERDIGWDALARTAPPTTA